MDWKETHKDEFEVSQKVTFQDDMVTRNCFLCEKELKGSFNGKRQQDFTEPPNDAIVFTAFGNYGSVVFDDPHYMLEISICDNCVSNKTKLVIKAKHPTEKKCPKCSSH